ncbi:MAG: hypothetical protein ACREOZ_00280 [Gloeomargaritales cyanobacterium]
MIIVAGPRESGKTTLANTLALALDLPIYDYSAQLQAQGKFDVQAIIQSVRDWPYTTFGIYDDHPFISEYVYGPLDRQGILPDFHSSEIKPIIQYLWDTAVIIYCRPNYLALDDPARRAYDLLFSTPLLPARVLPYDYTQQHDLYHLMSTLRALQQSMMLDRHHVLNGHRRRLWGRK